MIQRARAGHVKVGDRVLIKATKAAFYEFNPASPPPPEESEFDEMRRSI